MNTKTEQITIGGHDYDLSYPEVQTVSDAIDMLDDTTLVSMSQQFFRDSAIKALKTYIKPSLKTRRLLAYNQFSEAMLKKIEEDPALFEPMLTVKMKEMETNNDYFRILCEDRDVFRKPTNAGTNPSSAIIAEAETAEAPASKQAKQTGEVRASDIL